MSETQPERSSNTATPRVRTILVVDDHPPTVHAMGLLLKDSGFSPAVFEKGADALAYAQTHSPDGAILDIHLPDISGLVLADRLRKLMGPDRPIIMLSGDTSMENINSLPHVGATYFMGKPCNFQHLLRRLEELLAD